MSEKIYSVFVGGTEVNDYLLTRKQADALKEKYEDRGYDDVQIAQVTPTQEEIKEYMELHNADEAGIDNQWTMEDAEYHLLLSDKYYE